MSYREEQPNGQAVAQIKQTQVSEQVQHLSYQLEKLFEVLGILEDRLSPLLLDKEPLKEEVEKATHLVSHANFLRIKALSVQEASNKVTSILERLEL